MKAILGNFVTPVILVILIVACLSSIFLKKRMFKITMQIIAHFFIQNALLTILYILPIAREYPWVVIVLASIVMLVTYLVMLLRPLRDEAKDDNRQKAQQLFVIACAGAVLQILFTIPSIENFASSRILVITTISSVVMLGITTISGFIYRSKAMRK